MPSKNDTKVIEIMNRAADSPVGIEVEASPFKILHSRFYQLKRKFAERYRSLSMVHIAGTNRAWIVNGTYADKEVENAEVDGAAD